MRTKIISRALPRWPHGLIDQEDLRHHEANILIEQRIAAVPLKKDADNANVSPLGWENCKIYTRSFDLTRTTQCVAQTRNRPTCSPCMQCNP